MNLSHMYASRQHRAPFCLGWHGVALFCFLLLSVNVACAATMSFPQKATASITSIDANSGVIFAKDSASGEVFQFKLTNPALLRSLRVGQAFFVDIANKLVSFDGARINGNIVSLGPVDGAKPVGPVDGLKPVGPVDGAHPAPFSDGGVANCTITNIDNSRGLITARDNQTGHTFQFRPSNASFFQSLKVGQPVVIEFATNQVSLMINGNRTIIGSIVSTARSATQK